MTNEPLTQDQLDASQLISALVDVRLFGSSPNEYLPSSVQEHHRERLRLVLGFIRNWSWRDQVKLAANLAFLSGEIIKGNKKSAKETENDK